MSTVPLTNSAHVLNLSKSWSDWTRPGVTRSHFLSFLWQDQVTDSYKFLHDHVFQCVKWGLIMMRVHMITLTCVLVVLQVFGDESSQPRLECSSLCEQANSGFAGVCCGKMDSEKRVNLKCNDRSWVLWLRQWLWHCSEVPSWRGVLWQNWSVYLLTF